MKGIVYVIEGSGLVYYGSTVETLERRIQTHNSDYRKWKKGTTNKTASYDIIEKGDYTYKIVEIVEFIDKKELKERERWWIENNYCINVCVPNRTEKEWRQENKDHLYQKNKEYNCKIECECGSKIKKYEKSRHLKTPKHMRYLANKQITS